MGIPQSDVDEWFEQHPHALTEAAQEVRAAIMRAVPDAVESIKWKAPNFATFDDFATFNMRRPGVLQVILHTGAKPKPELAAIEIDGLGKRMRWADHNRAIITFSSADDVAEALPEFERIIAVWVSAAAG